LISCLCLGVKSRALVLNAMAENLDALKCGGWGVFIAPTTKMAVGEAISRWAHQTVRRASHVTQPLGFDCWSSDSWVHQTVRWCTGQHCSLSGAPFGACSNSTRVVRALFTRCSPFADDRWCSSRCSAWHTEQSGATPDGPVNYSGVAFPETRS
jgi:hypothetical protein